jgi:hypothetical protein
MPAFGIRSSYGASQAKASCQARAKAVHPCRMPEAISRIIQYGFHNKLGHVNCKGVLEYRNILIVALTNQDRFPLQMASYTGDAGGGGSAVWKA